MDVAGFAVGIAERSRLLDGPAHAVAGDVLIGLPRRACAPTATPWPAGPCSIGPAAARRAGLARRHATLADELLRPSVIYAPAVLALLDAVEVHAVAHITGGGLPGNLPRVLPADVDAVVERGSWDEPRIFAEIQQAGEISDDEMTRVFNRGVGMVVVVPADQAATAASVARSGGHEAVLIGRLAPGSGVVRLV